MSQSPPASGWPAHHHSSPAARMRQEQWSLLQGPRHSHSHSRTSTSKMEWTCPDFTVPNSFGDSSEAVVLSINSDMSGISGEGNNGSSNVERLDGGKRSPLRPKEESMHVKRARLEGGILDEYGIFCCQRCGNEETFGDLRAIKCTSCRCIIWFPPRYNVYCDENGSYHFGNVFPDGYEDEIGMLKEKLRNGTCALSFPYGEDDLMDFELTIIPEAGLFKGAKVVFSVDVPPLYPYASPKIRCKTKIYHPLFDMEGNVGIRLWREDRMSYIVQLLKNILKVKRIMLWRLDSVVVLNHEAVAMWKKSFKLFSGEVKRGLAGGFIGETYFPRCLVDD